MRRYMLWIAIGLVIGLAAAVGAGMALRPYQMHGSVIQPLAPAADFSLPAAQGAPFSLSAQRGKVVVLFFGYIHCTDVCPATLSQFKQIHQRLGADASRVRFVFVTVDPARDTPQTTAQYVAGFDPSLIGLSGSEAQLTPVWQGYGVYRKLDQTSPTDVSYAVEHSTQVYLIDRQGNLRATYPSGTPTDDMLQDVRYLLR